jgi:hypothetical protein
VAVGLSAVEAIGVELPDVGPPVVGMLVVGMLVVGMLVVGMLVVGLAAAEVLVGVGDAVGLTDADGVGVGPVGTAVGLDTGVGEPVTGRAGPVLPGTWRCWADRGDSAG